MPVELNRGAPRRKRRMCEEVARCSYSPAQFFWLRTVARWTEKKLTRLERLCTLSFYPALAPAGIIHQPGIA
jgi:hypothetical protein